MTVDARFEFLPSNAEYSISVLKGTDGERPLILLPACPDPRVLSCLPSRIPTLLHARSSAGVTSLAHRDRFSVLFT